MAHGGHFFELEKKMVLNPAAELSNKSFYRT